MLVAAMSSRIGMTDTAPFPTLPPPPDGAISEWPSAMRLRRFGTRLDDLHVKLEKGERLEAISALIECCTLPAMDGDFGLQLSVGKRIECLLVLAALDGARQVDTDLRCASCSQSLEVTLSIEELLEAGRAAGAAAVEVEMGGTIRRFRRPNGRDQAAWRDVRDHDLESIRREMAASLLADEIDGSTSPEFSPAELAGIEAALDRADPLLRGAVLTTCPDCGHSAEHEVDLVGFTLERLRRRQHALLETVHVLASRYHWTEADILGVPEWRRDRYVQMLGAEARR